VDIIEHNRQAWNRESSQGSRWSTPVSPDVIESARKGNWQVILTPNKPVPYSWFGNLIDKNVLCLASGGGQQAPILAAAGAKVVSFDLSEEQLKKDCDVAKRDNLQIRCVQGDMANLHEFADETFDLLFHPISNVFVADVTAVWSECCRVLKIGGDLLAGFMNPSFFLFDHAKAEKCGKLIVKRKLPFSEPYDLDSSQRSQWEANKNPAQFSHSLEIQIGGQIAAGFAIIGFYEDSWSDEATLLNRFSPTSIATRARKL
jgi:ubiquinone/menaquinone biosynthesis C-methylase UbiE